MSMDKTENPDASKDAEKAAEKTAAGANDRRSASPGRRDTDVDPRSNLSALHNVPVDVQVVLGKTRLPIGNILKLGRGAVVEVDRKVGEAVEVHVNNRVVARGEVVIVDDDRLGVTLTEIVSDEALAASAA